MTITVANKLDGVAGEYIGRPSPLGNPFVIGRDGDRDEVIRKYRDWLSSLTDGAALRELERLRDKYRAEGRLTLVCWCAPKACHGDVIAQAIAS
jgi:hypothetical protein